MIDSQNSLQEKVKRETGILKLTRLSDEPIISPDPQIPWKASAVFNTAAIYWNDEFHLIARSTNLPPCYRPDDSGQYISKLGYAVSKDGIHFERFPKPLLEPKNEQETRGLEDPRLVRIEEDDAFYMTYVGFGGRFDGDYRIMLMKSKNIADRNSWERFGVVLDEPNKNASLFPEKINGKYVLLHRRWPNIWISTADSLEPLKKGCTDVFTNHVEVLKTIPNSWEEARVGIAGPPIKVEGVRVGEEEIDKAWLQFYHAADRNNVYRLGAALLDANDPSNVIARHNQPILEPELHWEKNSPIPNVPDIIFSCGHAEMGDNIFVYYGGADVHIGVAYISKKDICFKERYKHS